MPPPVALRVRGERERSKIANTGTASRAPHVPGMVHVWSNPRREQREQRAINGARDTLES